MSPGDIVTVTGIDRRAEVEEASTRFVWLRMIEDGPTSSEMPWPHNRQVDHDAVTLANTREGDRWRLSVKDVHTTKGV